MATPVYPNAIKFSDIQTEFGGSNPISLSEYYAGGSLVSSYQTGQPLGVVTAVPTSGQALKLGNFQGTYFNFVYTITSNTANFNLYTAMLAAGYVAGKDFTVNLTVNTGIYVWTNSTSLAAFDTGTIPTATLMTITITNNGYIMGKGGTGGSANSNALTAPTTGGPAMNLQANITLVNNGYIGGGGGGGGAVQTVYYTSSGNYNVG